VVRQNGLFGDLLGQIHHARAGAHARLGELNEEAPRSASESVTAFRWEAQPERLAPALRLLGLSWSHANETSKAVEALGEAADV